MKVYPVCASDVNMLVGTDRPLASWRYGRRVNQQPVGVLVGRSCPGAAGAAAVTARLLFVLCSASKPDQGPVVHRTVLHDRQIDRVV